MLLRVYPTRVSLLAGIDFAVLKEDKGAMS